MPYRHDWEPHGVCMTIWGDTSGGEIDQAVAQIRDHPRVCEFAYVLADYRGVGRFDVSAYDTLLIAARDYWVLKLAPQLRVALVGSRADVLGAFRVYMDSSLIRDTFEIRTFEDYAEARRWVQAVPAEAAARP